MRLVYLDEAGTSPPEKVRIVAGIVVEADSQLHRLNTTIKEIYNDFAPAGMQDELKFHATDILSGKGIMTGLPLHDRLDLLKAALSAPRSLDIPIIVSAVSSESNSERLKDYGNLKKHYSQYCLAFTNCINRVEIFMMRRLSGKEVCSIIIEDNDAMKRHLQNAFQMIRERVKSKKVGMLAPDFSRYNTPNPPPLTKEDIMKSIIDFRHTINEPLFMKKGSAPALDIADACAFTFRRWINRYDHSEELLQCMVGEDVANRLASQFSWMKDGTFSAIIDGEYTQMDFG